MPPDCEGILIRATGLRSIRLCSLQTCSPQKCETKVYPLQGSPKSNFEGHCIIAKNKIPAFLWNSGSSMFFNSLAEMLVSQFGTCWKADLQKFRFHDLRHTFDSLLIQAGVSLAYVQQQMGHRSIQGTIDVYGHLIPVSHCEFNYGRSGRSILAN
jgi:hypothetical protein